MGTVCANYANIAIGSVLDDTFEEVASRLTHAAAVVKFNVTSELAEGQG